MGWGLCGIQRDGKNRRFGTKITIGERGEAYFSFVQWTGYNETRYNEVLGILKDIFCPSYSITYGKEPRYNQTSF